MGRVPGVWRGPKAGQQMVTCCLSGLRRQCCTRSERGHLKQRRPMLLLERFTSVVLWGVLVLGLLGRQGGGGVVVAMPQAMAGWGPGALC